jgi:DNA polymerase-4
MDAFFASVEARDDPTLRGIPMAVGGREGRGVLMTANYEARRFGVGSAMPTARALRLCPHLRIVPPRFEAYREASRGLRDILHRHTELVEAVSIDEAYLDVTVPIAGPPSGTLQAKSIKRKILTELGLTASAGVAPNKFLAKVASGMNKPDGLTVIKPDDALQAILDLPISSFFGIGPKTAARLQGAGIFRGQDLQRFTAEGLTTLIGKHGMFLHALAQGNDDRPVNPTRTRKSVGAERTFERDLRTLPECLRAIEAISESVGSRLISSGVAGRRVTVKYRYQDFTTKTRSTTFQNPVMGVAELVRASRTLLLPALPPTAPIRLLGVSVGALTTRGGLVVQGSLFEASD